MIVSFYLLIYLRFVNIMYSNLSPFYAHCVHRKIRKDMRDREDMRGIKYTYRNGYFLILPLI